MWIFKIMHVQCGRWHITSMQPKLSKAMNKFLLLNLINAVFHYIILQKSSNRHIIITTHNSKPVSNNTTLCQHFELWHSVSQPLLVPSSLLSEWPVIKPNVELISLLQHLVTCKVECYITPPFCREVHLPVLALQLMNDKLNAGNFCEKYTFC